MHEGKQTCSELYMVRLRAVEYIARIMHDMHKEEQQDEALHQLHVTFANDPPFCSLVTTGCIQLEAVKIVAAISFPSLSNHIRCMKWGFIRCHRDKPAPQLWMQPGWHMLLDVFLHHCWQIFQQDHLSTVEGLETALQQQIKSQVGAG